MPAKRIFVAIDISDEARRRVVDHIDKMRALAEGVRVSWERPEKLHLTLKFFGNLEERQLADVEQIVASIAKIEDPFTIELTGTGVFPNPRKPRVLWIGVERGGSKLVDIARQIENNARNAGFSEDERAFSPHLTIARLKDRKGSTDLAERHLGVNFEPVAFEVRTLKVYESTLLVSGSTYRLVSKQELRSG